MSEYSNDNYNNTNEEIRQERKENRTMIYVIMGIAAVVIIALVIILTSNKESNYEIGVNYIQAKNYDAAIAALQKIPPDDSKYALAQSKINYINGVKLYNMNDYNAAKMYLEKVSPSDEFYTDAKVLISKITTGRNTTDNTQTTIQQTDTVKKIIEKVDTVKKNIDPVADNQAAKTYVQIMSSFIEKFQNTYVLMTAGDNNKSPMTILNELQVLKRNFANTPYSGKNMEADLKNFKALIIKMMDARISYLQNANDSLSMKAGRVNLDSSVSERLYSQVLEQLTIIRQKYGV
jgi:tetratricopeptide (TPR) repeat protein